ncbi:424_t:CDS:2, partial [Gigaspora margarita]
MVSNSNTPINNTPAFIDNTSTSHNNTTNNNTHDNTPNINNNPLSDNTTSNANLLSDNTLNNNLSPPYLALLAGCPAAKKKRQSLPEPKAEPEPIL